MNNLKGIRFGRLIVLEKCGSKRGIGVTWRCVCDCGNIIETSAPYLRKGATTSCGCYHSQVVSSMKFVDLTGRKFGMLNVVGFHHKDKKHSFWECTCDCGKSRVVRSGSLTGKNVTSCGCRKESQIASEVKEYFYKNYSAIKEHKPLKNPKTNRWLSFDVYIPPRYFVEIHGGQHYKFCGKFYKDQETFEYKLWLDKIKKDFAEDNGVYIEVDLRKIKTFEDAVSYVEKHFQ